jgi:hypothetical protein
MANNIHRPLVLPIDIDVAERRAMALQFRGYGMNYREVSEAMRANYGARLPATYDERYAWRDVQSAMNDLRVKNMETANNIRVLELSRLDSLQATYMPGALNGDVKHLKATLSIMEQRAKLLGLYAPKEIKHSDWRTEIIDLVKQGLITRQEIEKDYGEDFARSVFDTRGEAVVEGSFAETEGDEEPGRTDGQVA